MNKFGGDWTKIKIEILVEYARAFLTIMKDRTFFKLMYFDGFAGSGFIIKDNKVDIEVTVGAARRIIEINDPRPFDSYYFVEKDLKNFNFLKRILKIIFLKRKYMRYVKTATKKLLICPTF